MFSNRSAIEQFQEPLQIVGGLEQDVATRFLELALQIRGLVLAASSSINSKLPQRLDDASQIHIYLCGALTYRHHDSVVTPATSKRF